MRHLPRRSRKAATAPERLLSPPVRTLARPHQRRRQRTARLRARAAIPGIAGVADMVLMVASSGMVANGTLANDRGHDRGHAKRFDRRERDKAPDPNSPFAKLAALKAQLEADAKERR
jgi:hypothetical protein